MEGLQKLLVQLAELAEAHFSLLTRNCSPFTICITRIFSGRGANWWQSPARELSVSGLTVYTVC